MRRASFVICLIAVSALAVLAGLPAALADDERESANEVYDSAKSGKIIPLARILASIRQRHAGEIVETKFEHRGQMLVYEIYVLDDKGRRIELYVDARTGKMIESEGDD